MKEIAGSIRFFVVSAFMLCVMSLFFVQPKSPMFFLLFGISVLLGIMWLILMGVKHYH